MTQYYAHSKEGKPPAEWHLLSDHLTSVAEKSREFASAFGAGDWAYLAGLWHDLGKYSREFQNKLFAENGVDAHIENPKRVDHSTAGAQYSVEVLKDKGKLIAYAIAGHHAGLPNGEDNKSSCLAERLRRTTHCYSNAFAELPASVMPPNFHFSFDNSMSRSKFAFSMSFLARMIFSALVDADFLDTEKFMDKEKFAWRKGYPTLQTLHRRLETFMARFLGGVQIEHIVNQTRADVLRNCQKASKLKPGLFSLTVPTGGGKTLSSISFAIQHALQYGKNRIIYVIPHTSIIEQNAQVFRQALGQDAVLEHHSNFEPSGEDHRSRLASENWDAPIVVTTNVQFFESLFASKTSQCRKLHNIANSVVILDEAQMLPAELLRPCLEALKELSDNYKTTVVLCTATQPALSTSETFKDGLAGVREIIPNPAKLYEVMKRVEIKNLSAINDEELIKKIISYEKALCVVNTRKHARVLFQKIKASNCTQQHFHLSALMCPAHRTQKLSQIKKALDRKSSCLLVSTQLIEAGVDIDFPVVFRAMTGIDSIAQAAGRCNREGKLSKGEVFVFSPQDGLPPGSFRQSAQTAETVSRRYQDILSLEAVEEYFRELFWIKGENELDTNKILSLLAEDVVKGNFPFRDVAEKFKMIKDSSMPVIIPWNDEAEAIIRQLQYAEYPARFVRQLQRFTVQIYPSVLAGLMPALECIRDQYYVLRNMDIYRDDLGLCPEDPTFHEIEHLIC